MRLPFGKYRGWPLSEVPMTYLAWLLESARLTWELREAITREIAARLDLPALPEANRGAEALPPELRPWASEIVESGFKAAARRHHPDIGGTNDGMRALLAAREALRELVGSEP